MVFNIIRKINQGYVINTDPDLIVIVKTSNRKFLYDCYKQYAGDIARYQGTQNFVVISNSFDIDSLITYAISGLDNGLINAEYGWEYTVGDKDILLCQIKNLCNTTQADHVLEYINNVKL